VRLDRAGLAQHLAALDVLTADAAQQRADVVARLALVEQLAEHLDAGDDGLLGVADADDLDFLADLDDALLDTAGDDGAAAGDREHVLDRHQERACRADAPGSGSTRRPRPSASGSRRGPARGCCPRGRQAPSRR